MIASHVRPGRTGRTCRRKFSQTRYTSGYKCVCDPEDSRKMKREKRTRRKRLHDEHAYKYMTTETNKCTRLIAFSEKLHDNLSTNPMKIIKNRFLLLLKNFHMSNGCSSNTIFITSRLAHTHTHVARFEIQKINPIEHENLMFLACRYATPLRRTSSDRPTAVTIISQRDAKIINQPGRSLRVRGRKADRGKERGRGKRSEVNRIWG